MRQVSFDLVFETITGQIIPGFAIPGVENLFEEGKTCDILYENMHQAYGRLCSRLESEEDTDLNIIVDSMNRICRLVAAEAFRFALTEKMYQISGIVTAQEKEEGLIDP